MCAYVWHRGIRVCAHVPMVDGAWVEVPMQVGGACGTCRVCVYGLRYTASLGLMQG